MRITLLTLLISGSFYLFGQQADISGTWYGTSMFIKQHSQLKYELKQEGSKITGFVVAKNLKKGDSIKTRVEGSWENDRIILKGVEVIYKVGIACMADNILSYQLNGDQETLVGRWKGTRRKNTCPPIAGGAVTLIKEQKQEYDASTSSDLNAAELSEIAETDDVGKVLVNELSKRSYYALIIGVNQYQDDRIVDLDNPINDANQLASVLIQHYSFDDQNVTVLQDPTREDIITSLDQLTGVVTEKDNLLIFYAGHGIWNEQLNQGYWLPSDASMSSKSYWLSNSTLRDYVGGIKSKHTLLISDACFSGGILKERAVFENSRAILEVYKLPSRKAMTSGTLKTVPDESVFIQYLIKNLLSNQSPLLSADQLFRTFKTAVINNSPNGQVPQYGPITQAGDEGGDFIFLREDR